MKQIESLEGRRMFAAVAVSHGVLRISGEASGTNSIAVDAGPGGTLVVTIHTVRASGQTTDLSKSFPASSARQISVRGGRGNDIINIGQAAPVSLPSVVLGLDGDDVIVTGDGNDYIDGGKGNDQIEAGGGNDVVLGGQGNDQLFGEAGSDILAGGDGSDLLNGGGGNDLLYADPTDAEVTGGADADIFDARAGLPAANDYSRTEDLLLSSRGRPEKSLKTPKPNGKLDEPKHQPKQNHGAKEQKD